MGYEVARIMSFGIYKLATRQHVNYANFWYLGILLADFGIEPVGPTRGELRRAGELEDVVGASQLCEKSHVGGCYSQCDGQDGHSEL